MCIVFNKKKNINFVCVTLLDLKSNCASFRGNVVYTPVGISTPAVMKIIDSDETFDLESWLFVAFILTQNSVEPCPKKLLDKPDESQEIFRQNLLSIY